MKTQFSQKSAYGLLKAQEKTLVNKEQQLKKELSQTKQALEFTREAIKSLEGEK